MATDGGGQEPVDGRVDGVVDGSVDGAVDRADEDAGNDVSELDAALERFFETDFVYADGEPNYGPMAASALEALGHDALTTGLLDIYLPRLSAFSLADPEPGSPWADLAGQASAAPALIVGLVDALAVGDWTAILRESVTLRLRSSARRPDPHATIRLAYAVLNLERDATRTRERELAFALGFFLARSASQENDAMRAAGAGSLAEHLSLASLAGAERYLANPAERRTRSLGVILPAALRVIVEHLEDAVAWALVDASFAGISASAQGDADSTVATTAHLDPEVERCAQDLREIRYRAACSVQEHAIVMAESCLREAESSPDRIRRSRLQHAAADAALRLSPPGYKEWR